MKLPCSLCNSKGHVTTNIAGDVHIATCSQCEGYGSHEPKIATRKKLESFGKVDIDSLLKEA